MSRWAINTPCNYVMGYLIQSSYANALIFMLLPVAEPPLGQAQAAALGPSRRGPEHTVNNKGCGEQEVGWI